MPRTYLYFKVELDQADEQLDRAVEEIARQIRKVHGVRRVEFSHAISPAGEDS